MSNSEYGPVRIRKPTWRIGWLVVCALIALLAATTGALERRVEANYENLFQRALVTFALARTLNGVISVIQGTEVALQPAGVGLTLTPGEILDPLNDLVERFSWVMLGASVSLGIQQVLLDISAWFYLQLALLGLALLVIIFGGLAWRRGTAFSPLLTRTFLIVVFLRFAVPLTLLANESVYQVFLEGKYLESSEIVRVAGAQIERVGREEMDNGEEATTEAEPGFLGAISQAIDSAAETLRLRQRLEDIKAQASAMIEHIVQLTVVFVLQTVVLPIGFLWVLLRVFNWLFRESVL